MYIHTKWRMMPLFEVSKWNHSLWGLIKQGWFTCTFCQNYDSLECHIIQILPAREGIVGNCHPGKTTLDWGNSKLDSGFQGGDNFRCYLRVQAIFFILFWIFIEPIVLCYILFQCWELNLSEPRLTSCRRRWSSCPPFIGRLDASSGRCSDRPWCSGARTSPKSRPVSSSWTLSSRARPRPRHPRHPQ